MKKGIFIVLLSCLFAFNTQAQFANSTGMSAYAELTSPVSLNGSSTWDYLSSFPIYLPFNFSIYGQTYTALNVMAGGGLNFPGLGVKELKVFWVAFAGGYYLVDKGTTSSLSPIGYTITGATGSQVLKVQWKNAGFKQVGSTVDTSDFVDFQIWLFEADSHMEIHFGTSSTSITTYGGTGSAPGIELIFQFDNCNDLFAIEGPCNLPSYSFVNGCAPFATYINGTPDSGIVYNIHPTATTGIQSQVETKTDIALYPNPVDKDLMISGLPVAGSTTGIGVSITNTVGEICFEGVMQPTSGAIRVPIQEFASGVYFAKIKTGDGSFIVRKFVKQ